MPKPVTTGFPPPGEPRGQAAERAGAPGPARARLGCRRAGRRRGVLGSCPGCCPGTGAAAVAAACISAAAAGRTSRVRTPRGLERLNAFADAVVAIAITLLILPLVD